VELPEEEDEDDEDDIVEVFSTTLALAESFSVSRGAATLLGALHKKTKAKAAATAPPADGVRLSAHHGLPAGFDLAAIAQARAAVRVVAPQT
jgi:hypothetical protein